MCYFFWSNTPTADNLSLPLSLLNAKIYIFLIVLECALYGELWLFAWHNMKIVKVSVLASNAIYFDYVLFIQRCTTHLLCESSNLSQFSIHWYSFALSFWERTHTIVLLLALLSSWHRIFALNRFAMQTCLLSSCSKQPNSRSAMPFCKSLSMLNGTLCNAHYTIMMQGKPDLSAHIQ